MTKVTLILCGTLLALGSPALGQDASDADAAIRAGSQQWSAAWNAGDAAAITALDDLEFVEMCRA